jgi:hypothetical protein
MFTAPLHPRDHAILRPVEHRDEMMTAYCRWEGVSPTEVAISSVSKGPRWRRLLRWLPFRIRILLWRSFLRSEIGGRAPGGETVA